MTQPPADVTAGSGFGFTVAAVDGFGNADPDFSGLATLSLASNPGSATLSGVLSAPINSGVAIFSGVILDKAATGATLRISSAILESAISSAIIVSAAAATQLVVTAQPPASVTAGSGFGLVVSALDQFGNIDPTFSGVVKLVPSNDPPGIALGGVVTATASAGVATFAGVLLDKVGSGDTLHATSGAVQRGHDRSVRRGRRSGQPACDHRPASWHRDRGKGLRPGPDR